MDRTERDSSSAYVITPEAEGTRYRTSPRRSPVLAFSATGLSFITAVLVVATRARFRDLIADFDLPLSFVTSFALSPAIPILLAVILIVTVANELIPHSSSISNAWNGIVVCLALGCLAIYLAGVFAPLMTILRGLS